MTTAEQVPAQASAQPVMPLFPDLAGKAVLITGGGSGIGEALVRAFAAQRARVAFIDLAAAASQALQAELRAAGHDAHFIEADLTIDSERDEAIAAARRAVGPLRALLNNAANDSRQAFDAVTPASWDAGIAVNLKQQFFTAQAVSRDMRAAGGGAIVNFGSGSWQIKQAGLPIYATAKSGVNGLTRSLARELGVHRIRVNTLVPGWTKTPRQQRLWLDDSGRATILREQCLPELLLPVHIAPLALFLASDAAVMCTAQEFVVDGGWV